MLREKKTAAMYNDLATHVWLGQNTWSFVSVAPNQNIYDVQVVAREFADSGRDSHPERLTETLPNLDMLGDWVDDWAPAFKALLRKADRGFFKWRVTEAPRIQSALSKSGKVILIGDAYHGIDPSAGFGTALSLEDGFTLALLIDHCPEYKQLPTYLSIFDKIVKQRSGKIAGYSRFMGVLLGLPDGTMQMRRDKEMSRFDPNKATDVKGNVKAKFGTPQWQAWMDDWDPVVVVEEAVKRYEEEVRLAPGDVVSKI